MKATLRLAGIVVTVVFVALGCSRGPGLPPGNTPVILQLNWTPDATFTGEFMATDKCKNFWANEGLSVEIQAGGFGIDPFAPIVARKAHFAVVGADKAIVAFSNGAEIRVVAVDFQRNPVGWIARKKLGIKSIKDIEGKKDVVLGDKVGTETTAILNVVLKRLGLSNKLSPKGVGFDFAYFVQNENLVYPVYLNEEPVRARLLNIDIEEIDPSAAENGAVKLYGNVIIVHKDFPSSSSQVIKAFLKGLKRGWSFAKEHPEEAVMLLRKYKELDTESMPDVLARSVKFATSAYGIDVPAGHMEISEWRSTVAVLKDAGVVTKDVNIQDLVCFGADE